MSGNCIQDQTTEKSRLRLWKGSWLELNLTYLLVGLGIGLLITLLLSAFRGEWISLRSAAFQFLFSTIISVCITNCIYISQKVLKFNKSRIWIFILAYYISAIIGMLVAIELIYLLRAWLFNMEYHFFHIQDAISSSLVVVIICTIIYAYQSQRERLSARIREKDLDVLKLKQLNTQAELATLQSKINPHFLYNSLNSIASLIHEDPDKAEDMTLKLSRLFRYSINQNQDDLVQVREELEIVSTYFDIEKVRFGDRISFKIEADEDILNTKIPRFLIQPLVENALKHGLKDVIENGELMVRIDKKADHILITISDNGSPFPEELEIGYGLQSTYDKLGLLYNNLYAVQITNQPVKQIKIQIPLSDG